MELVPLRSKEEAEYYTFCIESAVLTPGGELADNDDIVEEGQIRLNALAYQ